MRESEGYNPAQEWFKESLLLALGDSQDYFELARQANINGIPEDGLKPLYELDDRLCTLLGNMPNAPACEVQVPILRRILVRCDMAIANTWIMLYQQNPDLPEFREKALVAAKEQIDFLRGLPNYDVAADEGLPEDLRRAYLQLARIFD